MATTTVKIREIQKLATDSYLLMHPETDASVVLLASENLTSDTVEGALEELYEAVQEIVGGSVVTGVKGDDETEYRIGQVNITKENIGLGNVDNTADADKPVSSAVQTELDAISTEITEIQTSLSTKAESTDIPDVSEFITRAVSDLENYYTISSVDDTTQKLLAEISAIPKFSIDVVDELPTEDISSSTVYLLKSSTTESGNLYTEYVYLENTEEWEQLGTQTLDLSGYTTTEALNAAIAEFLSSTEVNELVSAALSDYTKTEDLSIIATSGLLSDAEQSSEYQTVSSTEKTTWNAKQDALTFDEAPTSGSTNPVTSGGVYTAVSSVESTLSALTGGTGSVTNAEHADEADKLSAAVTISLSGDVSGSTSFDGSASSEIAAELAASGVTAGTYSAVSVDAKGRVTDGGQVIEVGTEGQTEPSSTLAVGGLFFMVI